MFWFNPPRMLDKEQMLHSISAFPKEVIEIIELHNIDPLKYVSDSFGSLIVTDVLRDYDLSEKERKILINYARNSFEESRKKEKELLATIEEYQKQGFYGFIHLYKSLKYRDEDYTEERVNELMKRVEEIKYGDKKEEWY